MQGLINDMEKSGIPSHCKAFNQGVMGSDMHFGRSTLAATWTAV